MAHRAAASGTGSGVVPAILPGVLRIDQSRAWRASHGTSAFDAPALAREHSALNAADGTLHLLYSGFLVAGCAALALALVLGPLGGIGAEGPRSTFGWLAMMVALMSMPFGLMLLLLGGAKWLRNHRITRRHTYGSARV